MTISKEILDFIRNTEYRGDFTRPEIVDINAAKPQPDIITPRLDAIENRLKGHLDNHIELTEAGMELVLERIIELQTAMDQVATTFQSLQRAMKRINERLDNLEKLK